MSLFSTCGWILRLGVTVAQLASVHIGLVLLAAFAIPAVLTSTWRPAVERGAQEGAAQANRLARHLFTIATTAPPGKEVRVTGIGDRLVEQRRRAWERGFAPVSAVRWASALWHTLAWASRISPRSEPSKAGRNRLEQPSGVGSRERRLPEGLVCPDIHGEI